MATKEQDDRVVKEIDADDNHKLSVIRRLETKAFHIKSYPDFLNNHKETYRLGGDGAWKHWKCMRQDYLDLLGISEQCFQRLYRRHQYLKDGFPVEWLDLQSDFLMDVEAEDEAEEGPSSTKRMMDCGEDSMGAATPQANLGSPSSTGVNETNGQPEHRQPDVEESVDDQAVHEDAMDTDPKMSEIFNEESRLMYLNKHKPVSNSSDMVVVSLDQGTIDPRFLELSTADRNASDDSSSTAGSAPPIKSEPLQEPSNGADFDDSEMVNQSERDSSSDSISGDTVSDDEDEEDDSESWQKEAEFMTNMVLAMVTKQAKEAKQFRSFRHEAGTKPSPDYEEQKAKRCRKSPLRHQLISSEDD